ncbi:MAG TPA: protein kinase, partial [Planctomycetota bacterium]|nr:protein kinase [Planctomycetota bacterium]
VVDFGLAKLEEQETALTRTGSGLGTPYYMAPEQFTGASEVGARADVWSLGVLLYELLTGERPFKGKTQVEVADNARTFDPPPPSALCKEASWTLDAVVGRALEKDPAARYANASELLEDFERARAGHSVAAPVARRTARLVKAARIQRSTLIGFAAATLLFVPAALYLRSTPAPLSTGDGVAVITPPPAPPAPAPAPVPAPAPAPAPAPVPVPVPVPVPAPAPAPVPAPVPPTPPSSAIDQARADIASVPRARDLVLPQDTEAARALLALETSVLAPAMAGDPRRARAGLSRVAIPEPLRAELTRELDLLDKLRSLVLLLVRADPRALGDHARAWGGESDLGLWPHVLADDTIELRDERATSCIEPLALATATLDQAAGPTGARATAVLAWLRGEPLPSSVADEDASPFRAMRAWLVRTRPLAAKQREADATDEWETFAKGGDPAAWAGRFALTPSFEGRRRDWTLAAAKLGVERLLGGARQDGAQVAWRGASMDLLSFDVAFVGTAVRVERSETGLELAGVRVRLDSGKATQAAVKLEASGPLRFALRGHELLLDETGKPTAKICTRDAEADIATAEWPGPRRLDATWFEHDPTKVLEIGGPVVMFKLERTRLAKLPYEPAPPAGTPTLELELASARIEALELTPSTGALEAALPGLAETRLRSLLDRAHESGKLLRAARPGRAGLRLEGTWRETKDGLEADGPATLATLVRIDSGAVLLDLSSTAGVTLGLGDGTFPAPLTRTTAKKLALVASRTGDSLTVDEILRVEHERVEGLRPFVLKVAPGAHVALSGLQLVAD